MCTDRLRKYILVGILRQLLKYVCASFSYSPYGCQGRVLFLPNNAKMRENVGGKIRVAANFRQIDLQVGSALLNQETLLAIVFLCLQHVSVTIKFRDSGNAEGSQKSLVTRIY